MSRRLKFKRSNYVFRDKDGREISTSQWDFLKCRAYISAFVGGMGSGKTFIFLRRVLERHVNKRNPKTGKSHGLIVYPTMGLADELFIGPFSELLDSQGIPWKFTRSPMSHFMTPYGRINVFQLQTPERIVGSAYTYAGFDEFDVGRWRNCDVAFKKTVGRMRGCKDPEIFFVTTPEGTHYVYKLFVEDNKDGQRILFRARTTDNPHLPDSYASNMEEQYDDKMISAYRDGQFVNMTQGTVYDAFSRDRNVRNVELDPYLPLVVMCDFNRGAKPMCWNVGQIVGDIVYVKWALHKTYINTYDMCEYLDSFLRERVRVDELGRLPSMEFYGDYSGQTETSNSTRNDWQIIEDHFSNKSTRIRVNVRPTRSVRDGVNAVNGMLKNARGDARLFVDPEADWLIRDLELTVWDAAGMREDQSNGDRSHAVSALRYLIDHEFPLRERIKQY